MDPYVEACDGLERAGVRYLVIGAFGINLYAGEVGAVFTTADCDLMLAPDKDQLRRALEVLAALGYVFEAGGEPLPDLDPLVLAGIVRARAVVRAFRPDARIDLPLEAAGVDFEAMWSDQRRLVVEDVALRVGPLRMLIRSKQIADRPKDRAFLEAYRATLDEMLRRDESHP
jgi:hypothetical protein